MKIFAPVLVVIGVAIWSVWPLVKCGNCIANFGHDGELINWIMNTSGGNLYGIVSGGMDKLFDGNIFYPYRNVLAYSDMFMISGLWVYPIIYISHNYAMANLLSQVVGQVVTMLVMYLWWKKLSGKAWAAAVGVTAFGMSQIRMEYQVHLQMWSLQLMLIGSWLISDWLEEKKDWKLFTGAAILGLQVWESLLPVYFAGLMIASKIITRFLNNTLSYPFLSLRGGGKKGVILAAIIFVIISTPPLMAYRGVGREFSYKRDIREAAHNGMSIEEVFTKFGSPGLYILFTVSVWQITKSQILNTKSRINSKSQILNIKWLVLVLITSLIVAMGPVLKWQGETVKVGKIPIPLPYAAAYYLIPGFDALRTPSRWMWVAGWAVSGLIAIGFSKSQILNPKLQINSKFKVLIPSLIFIVVFGGIRITRVRRLPDYESIPVVYKQLEELPDGVVLEVPMGNENLETERMLYSLYHGKKLVNGFSGFTPPGYWKMAKWVNDGVDEAEKKELKKMGVSYLIYDDRKLEKL